MNNKKWADCILTSWRGRAYQFNEMVIWRFLEDLTIVNPFWFKLSFESYRHGCPMCSYDPICTCTGDSFAYPSDDDYDDDA